MTETATTPSAPAPRLASDAEREQTVALLRDHWLAGRLTVDDLEERAGEAYAAREVAGLWQAVRGLPVSVPVPPRPVAAPASGARAVWAFVLGLIGLCVLVMSFGLLSFLSLPLSSTAWLLGGAERRARAGGPGAPGGGLASVGEVIGAIGTSLAAVALAGCGAMIAAG